MFISDIGENPIYDHGVLKNEMKSSSLTKMVKNMKKPNRVADVSNQVYVCRSEALPGGEVTTFENDRMTPFLVRYESVISEMLFAKK